MYHTYPELFVVISSVAVFLDQTLYLIFFLFKKQKPFPSLLGVNCLQLKIISMSKRQAFGSLKVDFQKGGLVLGSIYCGNWI